MLTTLTVIILAHTLMVMTSTPLARGLLSLLTMEDMVMVETLMFLSPDLCTPMDMESTILVRGLLSLLITLLILMDPATSMCQDPILTMELMSTTARVSRLNQIKSCDQILTCFKNKMFPMILKRFITKT